MSSRRLDVRSAAEALGLSVDAVRMRARRGSLASEKDAEGHVWVWVDTDESQPNTDETSTSQATSRELIEQLRSENEHLRDQLEEANTRDRENRRLLAAALERMPELESPEPSETAAPGPAEPSEGSEYKEDSAEPERGARRPWWRRILGG